MKLNTILIFYILTLLTSCNGQVSTKNANHNSIVVLGDTVSELSKSIWIVFQATNGDYWYGSDTDGVYRFDGKTIINFSTKDGLSSNRTRDIQEDKQGNIYISNMEGINKYDGHTFTTLTAIPSTSSRGKTEIKDLIGMTGKTFISLNFQSTIWLTSISQDFQITHGVHMMFTIYTRTVKGQCGLAHQTLASAAMMEIH